MTVKETRWKPKGNRLIVKRVDEMEGCLIIAPSQSKQSSMIVEIVETGTLTDEAYNIGEKLLIGRYSGYSVPVLNRAYTDCMIVNEDDILCFDSANVKEI